MPVYVPRAEPLYYAEVPVKPVVVTETVVVEAPVPHVRHVAPAVAHHKAARSSSHVSVNHYHAGSSKGYSPAHHGYKTHRSYGKGYGHSSGRSRSRSYGGGSALHIRSSSGYPVRNHYHSSRSSRPSGYSSHRRRW